MRSRGGGGVLLSPRWLALHVLAVVLFAVCLRLAWWQFMRAEAGNGRSLGYALQWPGFGIFVLGMWAWLARDAVRGGPRPAAAADTSAPGRLPDDVVLPPLREPAAPGVGAGAGTEDDGGVDDELAAYNRMLAALHRHETATAQERNAS